MAQRCAAAKILRPLTESIAKAPTTRAALLGSALTAAQLERLRHLDFALQRIAADRPRVTTDMARDFANRRQGKKSSIRICRRSAPKGAPARNYISSRPCGSRFQCRAAGVPARS